MEVELDLEVFKNLNTGIGYLKLNKILKQKLFILGNLQNKTFF